MICWDLLLLLPLLLRDRRPLGHSSTQACNLHGHFVNLIILIARRNHGGPEARFACTSTCSMYRRHGAMRSYLEKPSKGPCRPQPQLSKGKKYGCVVVAATLPPAPRLDAGMWAAVPPLLQYSESASDTEKQVQYLAGQA